MNKELEQMMNESYWDSLLNSCLMDLKNIPNGKQIIKEKINRLVKLLKDEIPDYCVYPTPRE